MIYRFGLFEFDAESGSLRRSGHTLPLERQPARALARLVTSAGEVVSREQMIEAVWGHDTHVDFDRGLAYCLSQIRGVLGDSGTNPRFVQTLPRKGYRLLVPVEIVSDPLPVQPAPRPRGAWRIAAAVALVCAVGLIVWKFQSPPPDRSVIAVSIFDNETGLPEHDRLVSGLSDLVVTRLSQVAPSRIAVIGNAPILRQPRNIRNLKALRAEVGAGYVVLGQLQTAETGLRFITHLIRVSDGIHLKANRIPLPDGRITGLESAVVAEFERAVRQHLLP